MQINVRDPVISQVRGEKLISIPSVRPIIYIVSVLFFLLMAGVLANLLPGELCGTNARRSGKKDGTVLCPE